MTPFKCVVFSETKKTMSWGFGWNEGDLPQGTAPVLKSVYQRCISAGANSLERSGSGLVSLEYLGIR